MMFLKYFPFCLAPVSRIYVANPPLYGIPVAKGKMKFFSNNMEYVEYVESVFCKDNDIKSSSKKSLTKSEIVKLLYRNIDYLKYINHIANTFAIDPKFLEFLLYNKDLSFAKFKSTVEKAYGYTNVTKENGVIMIHGLVGSLYQTVFFNDRLLAECAPIIDLMNRSDRFYYLNGKKATIYDIMLAFSECEPSGMTRYKGLGKLIA